MMRLEGTVNGRTVHEQFSSLDMATAAMVMLLPVFDGARMLLILGTMRLTLLAGRTWEWIGEGFTLTVGWIDA